MRCPSCHQNIRIQGKFCPKCGDQIFGLPVRGPAGPPNSPPSIPPPASLPHAASSPLPPPVYPPSPPPAPSAVVLDDDYDLADYPAAPSSAPVLDITLEDTPVAPAGPAEAVGETCPYCRFPIKAGEPALLCPSCGVPHHRECWQENGGCTVYGCRSSPAMAGTAPVAAPPAPLPTWTPPAPYQYSGLPREALALLEVELDRLATNALVFSILGLLIGLLSIIGLFTGISVLGQIYRSGLPARSARVKAWIAVALSAVVIIFWAGMLTLAAAAMQGRY